MENQLQVFENKDFGRVRVIDKNGQPWWVLRDVCSVLKLGSPHKVAERLDEDEKGRSLIPTPGGAQNMAIISESGLYAVILRSDKPNARAFRKWITSDVVPSIRRHGAYITDETLRRMLEDGEFTDSLVRRLSVEKDSLLGKMEALAPKVRYHDVVLQCENAVQVSIIAKDYGMTAATFNKLLHGLGVQYKMADTWLLYEKHADKGYTVTRTYHVNDTTARVHTYWTQSGRRFLYDLLKWYGIPPCAERPGGAFVGGDDNICP